MILSNGCISELHFVKAMGHRNKLLGTEDAGSSDSFDLLLSDAGEEAGLDNDWLLGENTLAQNLKTESQL